MNLKISRHRHAKLLFFKFPAFFSKLNFVDFMQNMLIPLHEILLSDVRFLVYTHKAHVPSHKIKFFD